MSDTPATAAPSRGRAIFYVVVIFIAGAVFGSALTIGIGRRVIERTKNPAIWNVEAMRRLDHRLDLTPEQRERVRPILVEMAQRMREVRIASRREWTAIIQDTRDRLRAELTPAQQVEFDKLAARTRENLGRLLGAPPETGRAAGPSGPARPRE